MASLFQLSAEVSHKAQRGWFGRPILAPYPPGIESTIAIMIARSVRPLVMGYPNGIGFPNCRVPLKPPRNAALKNMARIDP